MAIRDYVSHEFAQALRELADGNGEEEDSEKFVGSLPDELTSFS